MKIYYFSYLNNNITKKGKLKIKKILRSFNNYLKNGIKKKVKKSNK